MSDQMFNTDGDFFSGSSTDGPSFQGFGSNGPGFSIPSFGQQNLQSSPPDGVSGVRNIIGFQGQQIGKYAPPGAIKTVGKALPGVNGIIDGVKTFNENPNNLNIPGRLLQSVGVGGISTLTPPLVSAFDSVTGSYGSNFVKGGIGSLLEQYPMFKKTD